MAHKTSPLKSKLPPSAECFLKKHGLLGQVIPLQGDGSNRRFFRIKQDHFSSLLISPQEGPFGRREAAAYVSIAKFLGRKGLPVPKILAYEEETGYILVEDLGDQRLQDLSVEEQKLIYPLVIKILVSFQQARKGFDLRWTLETPRYDAALMWEREALYFVESFLGKFCGVKGEKRLLEELEALWQEAQKYLKEEVLLHRDFQSRNIMIKDGRPYLIDFQGARLGPPAYDLASLLLDPYSSLPAPFQEELLHLYLQERETDTLPGYFHFALFRLFQVLGALAKLSLYGKTWFAAYIPCALQRLKYILQTQFSGARFLLKTLEAIESKELVERVKGNPGAD